METVPAELVLPGEAPARLLPLDGRGRPLAEQAATARGAQRVLRLGGDPGTLWYEIRRE